MKKTNILKGILKDSIFGALFTLWTAPIDDTKLKLPSTDKSKQASSNWLFTNLIIGQRS